MPSEAGIEVRRDFETHENKRFNFEDQWSDIAQYMVPTTYPQFSARSTSQWGSTGEKRNQLIFDTTAVVALSRAASILMSLLCPSGQTWQHLRPPKQYRRRPSRRVQEYFDYATEMLFQHRYAPFSNFSQVRDVFKSILSFGTGAVYIDKNAHGKGLRYRGIHLSELYIVENHQRMIDKVFRYFSMTIKAAYDMWGESLPPRLMDRLKTSPGDLVEFIHRVQPNHNYDPGRLDPAGMKYESVYLSLEGNEIIETGGHRTMPYAVSRYEVTAGEVYGRSPGMDVLPSVKTLNEQKKTLLKQGQRAVDLILLTNDDALDGFSMKPGAINGGGVSPDGRPLVHALPVGDVNIGKDMMELEAAAINDNFFITLFQILMETPTMTATEVVERVREKGLLLAPTIGDQESNFLSVMTEREVDLLFEQGIIPPPPAEIAEEQAEYEMEYDTPITRARRAEEASGGLRSLEGAMAHANATGDRRMLDWFNLDAMTPELAQIQGMPARWVNSVEQVRKLREQQAAAQQEEKAIAAAPGQAALANAASKMQQAA